MNPNTNHDDDDFEQASRDGLNEDRAANASSKTSNAALRQAADEFFVHGLLLDQKYRDELKDQARLQRAIDKIRQESPRLSKTATPWAMSRRFLIFAASGSLAASLLMMMFFFGSNHADAALDTLDRIIEASKCRLDRSYKIQVVEEYDKEHLPRDLQTSGQRSNPEMLEGAILHVRSPNEFVFVRRLTDGQSRYSGCDGRESWAFKEVGPIHISTDINRFRGSVPGQQQDLPFINLHSDLEQLKIGYDIELKPEAELSRIGIYLSRLVATRKSVDVRGPKLVDIRFDSKSGVVYEIKLDGLPRQGGGPKSVTLELMAPESLGTTDFGPDFFSHTSHHEPTRKVRYEE